MLPPSKQTACAIGQELSIIYKVDKPEKHIKRHHIIF